MLPNPASIRCAAVTMGLAALLIPAARAQEPGAASNHPLHEGQPSGALTGSSVFLSAGHGWMWNDKTWVTQRGNSHGMIEDHSNAEIANQYTSRYLWNAGARVHTVRERCMNPNMVIVDEGYGGWEAIGPWDEERNPGAYGQSHVYTKTVAGESTAGVRFTPDIPESGWYGVYAWYNAGPRGTLATDARITINHAGGDTLWVQNLNHDDSTWKYMGSYWFDKGQDAATGSVVIENNSDTADQWLVVDAVRFGGGMGDIIRGGRPSGKPRWEESGRYYAEFMGFDPTQDTRKFDTVSAMPLYSEWEMEPWEAGRSIYVSCHTNASGNGKSRGMFSFVYGPNEWDPLTSFTGYPKGDDLVLVVHEEVMRSVHQLYDADWRDGAKITRWLGETNPRNNSKMPMALFEYGFHDNPEDAAYILDPKFRDTVARGTYRGIVKYYSEHVEGFPPAAFIPEKPTHLNIVRTDGGARIAWQAPPAADSPESVLGDPATGYRVYTSLHGKGFDDGVPVEGTGFLLADVPTTTTLFVRVTATNPGGESFPSETLAILAAVSESRPEVLVVNGFDRLDRGLNLVVQGGVERGILERMNTFDYAIQHGKALEASGIAYDSASNEAVIAGHVVLKDYRAIVWILGQESTGSTFDEAERALVREYLAGGGSLFVSGSEIASDLAKTDPAFLSEVLHASLAKDDAKTNSVLATRGSLAEGMSLFFFERGNAAPYPVKAPDVLVPADGARAMFTYRSADAAGIQFEGATHRLVYLGFPFETIKSDAVRNDLMRRSMEFLLAPVRAAQAPPSNQEKSPG